MSNRTRNLIKGTAVLLVILAVLMNKSIVIIPAIAPYTFWIVVVAFGMILIASK
jgi:hypothetical protein